MKLFRSWATGRGLSASETSYVARQPGRRMLLGDIQPLLIDVRTVVQELIYLIALRQQTVDSRQSG
jgi:hypothetical protein